MPEIRTCMVPVEIDMTCEKCGGIMRPTGETTISLYIHKCTICKRIQEYDKEYPYIVYIRRK